MSQYFVKGSNLFDGILCYIKDEIEFDKFENQTWYGAGNPKNYICSTEAHNNYLYPSFINNYVGFIFSGYYIKPDNFVIKGRSINDLDLLQDWDLIDLNQYNNWITLESKNNYPINQLQNYTFDIETKFWFTQFRIVSTGLDSSGNSYYITFEFFGWLATKLPKINSCLINSQKCNTVIYIFIFITK